MVLAGIGAAAGAIFPAGIRGSCQSALITADANPVDKEGTAAMLERIFQSDDGSVMKLVNDAYLQCVVEKIPPPIHLLNITGLLPEEAFWRNGFRR
jgi:hypothetical protein